MDSFDPFAGFATEMKASLPNGGIANSKAPSAGEVSGGPQKIVPATKANAPIPGGGNGGAYQRSPAANPSQQPMMKGMPMMVMGGSGSGSAQESQHMFQQTNAPMPSFSSPNPTLQQSQQPMQWGPNNNSFQPQQQNFSIQQGFPAKYPHAQQNPAHSQFQPQLAPNQAPHKSPGIQPTQKQPVQPQFAQQQLTQQQLTQQQPTQQQPTQQQPTQQQPTQQQPTQQQPTQQQQPAKVPSTQVQPYPQQQSWQQPLPPQQQNEQDEEQDAIFCRIPSIVHAKTGDEGDAKDLRRTNSDDVSQLNDDMSSFCPPPPPYVAPPPPPPSNEQAALEAVAPFTEQPAPTQSNDVDIFGGLFDYPASPPFTPYDIENVKSMDSTPDGILASNPSIDDDYLFSDDDDDDDFFGIFGGDSNNKAPAATNSKSSDLSSNLGITKRTEKSDAGREETEGKSMKDNTCAAERSHKSKLPPGGEFYDCKVYTSTLGVMFFAPFELTDSLFRHMDRTSVVEALDQRPVVAHVLEQGAAKSVGVQVGHVLLQVNGKEVKTPQEANLAIRESARPMKLLFYVLKEPINVAEGQYMVKYDTRDTGAPPTSRDWKPKYVVVGGIIAHSHMLNMYRSKAEYDIAVMDTQARRHVSVKVKQFTLKGARLWNEVGKENGISKPHVRKVKYRSQMKPWNYIVILPLKRDPIKISVPGSSTEKDNGLQQLKIVHEGIRQFIHDQSSNKAVATASATATEP